MEALLVLETGKIFNCKTFTGNGEKGGEIVFNTSMTGYQEVLTDPSYSGQMVVMTYPMIGSYGINFFDIESNFIHPSVFLLKEYQHYTSNFRSKIFLSKYLSWYGVIGVEKLDTRSLTKYIREHGSMRAIVSTKDLDPLSLLNKVKLLPKSIGLNIISKITTGYIYRVNKNNVKFFDIKNKKIKDFWKFKGLKSSVVIYDFGLKFNIFRYLIYYDFEIIVVPANTEAWFVEEMNPDGIILSNGPGDPSSLKSVVESVKILIRKKIPIFGICLGHQLLSIAIGGTTYKLKFGHRGANHPVKNLLTGKIEITSQNHGFAVEKKSLASLDVIITHLNLNDNTVEGIKHKELPCFSVQYHPEGCPGPRDSSYLFKEFKELIKINDR